LAFSARVSALASSCSRLEAANVAFPKSGSQVQQLYYGGKLMDESGETGLYYDEQGDAGFHVVHGHVIVPSPQFLPNRTAIDSGAYETGILTSLVVTDR
jgi:hypothetical protein